MVNLSSGYKKSKFFKQLSLTPLTKGEWLTSKVIWYSLALDNRVLSHDAVREGALQRDHRDKRSRNTLSGHWASILRVTRNACGNCDKERRIRWSRGEHHHFSDDVSLRNLFSDKLMPTYLQEFAHVLPLFYLIEGLNNVMVYGNYSQALVDLAVLIVLSAIVFVLAVRFFKWRED